jgi:lipopolysaccharide-induced tumor necrosis factor-alpha factor
MYPAQPPGGYYPPQYPTQQQVYPQQQGYPQQPIYINGPIEGQMQGTTMVMMPPGSLTGMPQQQQQQQQVIMIPQQQTHLSFSRDGPTMCVCPNCHTHITTSFSSEPGCMAWLCCIALLWASPLCLIPFCIPGCNDVTHTCPRCQILIARLEAGSGGGVY